MFVADVEQEKMSEDEAIYPRSFVEEGLKAPNLSLDVHHQDSTSALTLHPAFGASRQTIHVQAGLSETWQERLQKWPTKTFRICLPISSHQILIQTFIPLYSCRVALGPAAMAVEQQRKLAVVGGKIRHSASALYVAC